MYKTIYDFMIPVRGKTYAEAKELARSVAVTWSIHGSDLSLSYGEIVLITEYFHNLGRRYGLLREFRENGIC